MISGRVIGLTHTRDVIAEAAYMTHLGPGNDPGSLGAIPNGRVATLTQPWPHRQRPQEEVEVVDAEMEPGARPGRRRMVEIAVFAALIVGAIVTLPGLGDVRDRPAGANIGPVVGGG